MSATTSRLPEVGTSDAERVKPLTSPSLPACPWLESSIEAFLRQKEYSSLESQTIQRSSIVFGNATRGGSKESKNGRSRNKSGTTEVETKAVQWK